MVADWAFAVDQVMHEMHKNAMATKDFAEEEKNRSILQSSNIFRFRSNMSSFNCRYEYSGIHFSRRIIVVCLHSCMNLLWINDCSWRMSSPATPSHGLLIMGDSMQHGLKDVK